MPLTNRQLALLHVAKRDLRLDDESYRHVLARLAGVTSAKELDKAGLDVVLGFFEHMGWNPLRRSGPDYGARPGFASPAQLELIRTLWREWSDKPDGAGLEAWLRRTFKVDSPRFLTVDAGRKAITALKQMKANKAKKSAHVS